VSATTIIALYAAIVATVVAAFQFYSWWHARQPHIRVGVKRRTVIIGGSSFDAIVVTAINNGDHPVRVTACYRVRSGMARCRDRRRDRSSADPLGGLGETIGKTAPG
jgi:hypothetical protein